MRGGGKGRWLCGKALPSMHEALGLIPCTPKEKTENLTSHCGNKASWYLATVTNCLYSYNSFLI
jgi:hypothetical protein